MQRTGLNINVKNKEIYFELVGYPDLHDYGLMLTNNDIIDFRYTSELIVKLGFFLGTDHSTPSNDQTLYYPRKVAKLIPHYRVPSLHFTETKPKPNQGVIITSVQKW